MSLQDIPEELKLRQQWIVWRSEDIGALKPTKVPYSPLTGLMANVNNPNDWGTIKQAIDMFEAKKFSGIGFVFTDTDPYSFIDLDDPTYLPNGQKNQNYQIDLDRQVKIFHEFDSYSEISPSGKGLHTIVKGIVPAGRRRSFIEIYSSQRYATFTGNVYNAKPIIDQQEKLMQLWEQMGKSGTNTYIYQGTDKETCTDQEIMNMAVTAENAEKFSNLYGGNWHHLYQSQSEADYALIDMLAFYTQHRAQIERLFKASALGKREKASRKDYLLSMVNKSFDRMLPSLDFDGFKIALDKKLAEQAQFKLPFREQNLNELATPILVHSSDPKSIAIPPGLMGELAQFFYQAAPRPVPEIALAGAIGLMAGVCGRAYNISGIGLNQYVLVLAPTGSGKESMASGIDRLISVVRSQVPTVTSFIGPAEIASGQALIKYLNQKSQCFVSILGEFGLRLEVMSSTSANSAEKNLKRMLLDLYHKSGHGQVFRPTIFADSDKNLTATEAPAFSILGESIPERFYGILNEDMISEGLLPRFMLIEYNGQRPKLNEQHLQATPSFSLIDKFASLVANCEIIMHAKKVINVRADDNADRILREFDKYCDNQINGTSKEVLRQLWNRAHLKTLKLSALIAVGVNLADPMITAEYVQWAINMVQSDIRALSIKFEAGLVGHNTNETKQTEEMLRILKEYVVNGWDKAKGYMDNKRMFDDRVIPYAYLNKRLQSLAAFRNDRLGATAACKRAIQLMVDSDKIREVSRLELVTKYGTTQKAYIISNTSVLN